MKRILILCCCFTAVFQARAQLTLDECRRLAREHYPEIRQYDLIRQTAEYTLSNARRAYLPRFGLSAQATWQTAVPDFPDALTDMLARQGVDFPGMDKDQYKLQLEMEQTIWDGGQSSADKRIAEAEAAEQRRSADVDFHTLQGRVDDLYFGILLLDERLLQTDYTLGLLRSNLDKVRALQRNGVAMQTDADAVEAELLTVNQQRTQVAATRDSYRRMLGVFIGRRLDGETAELMETIRFVRDHFGMTILLIEHDMKLVSGICERLTVLNFGQVLCTGPTQDVLSNPEVIKAYLGE